MFILLTGLKLRESRIGAPSRAKKSRTSSYATSQMPKMSHISRYPGQPLTTTAQTLASGHSALSPIASLSSSTSCIPKSSSSTGPISGNWPLDYEILYHPEKGSIQCLSDIDGRLEAINE